MSKCASNALAGGEDTEVSEDVIPEKSLAPGQKLEQNFNLFSICGIAVTTGESWIVLGNSLVLAIYNGGPPGVLYGFIVDSFFYWIVAASIAELASAIPSSATVYHWATITAGRHGRICGWYAGWWNLSAWVVGVASLVSFMSLQLVAIYATLHPGYIVQEWHIFCAYIASTWLCCCVVLFFNKLLPLIESTGAFFILAGFLISVIVCAVMPHVNNQPYASNSFVWKDWQNDTGWSSNGFVFCLGMLNAAFAVCAPDIPSHLAEEIPNPKRNVPLAIFAQYVASFITGLVYLITLFYTVHDLPAILAQDSIFPLSLIYLSATQSRPATAALIVLALIPTAIGTLGGFAVAGRTLWALARDNAAPFPNLFNKLDASSTAPAPFNATLLVGVLVSFLGCIYLGSARAFNDIAGSFVVLISLSYLAAILPHFLSRRRNITQRGSFWMPGIIGDIVNAISCLYLAAFSVIFCFPFSLPVTAKNMNYTPVIVGAVTIAASLWWLVKRGKYEGPTNLPAGYGDSDKAQDRN